MREKQALVEERSFPCKAPLLVQSSGHRPGHVDAIHAPAFTRRGARQSSLPGCRFAWGAARLRQLFPSGSDLSGPSVQFGGRSSLRHQDLREGAALEPLFFDDVQLQVLSQLGEWAVARADRDRDRRQLVFVDEA